MENEILTAHSGGNIALRRIPVSKSETEQEAFEKDEIDKIKILELSTAVDKWEKEILFGENGFYSLKGKEVENKSKEFTGELERFIRDEIAKMSFVNPDSKEMAHKIKQEKLNAVKNQMEIYSREQLQNWETETYENALNATLERAVLYKNNPLIITVALKNGLKILEVISRKDNWSKKLYSYKQREYKSNFHLAIVKEFLKEKDINGFLYFQQNKEDIISEDKEQLEKSLDKMRVNIIAYNWAKEIFSYNYDEKTYEKELKQIEDEEIRTCANSFYNDLKQIKKRQMQQEEKDKNIANWKEVMEIADKDTDRAALYIDYAFKPNSIKKKKEYIEQIRKNGVIITDKKEFLELFSKVFENFQAFKDSDISDYRGCLSAEDFSLFEKIQNYTEKEFKQTEFDYKYALKLMKESGINKDDEKYDSVVMYFISLEKYKKEKEADLEARKKIIDTIFTRPNTK